MKDKKLIKSLNKITPTKEEKSIMLENILENKNSKRFNYKYLIRFSTCLIIMLVLVSVNPSNLSEGNKKEYPVIRTTFSMNNFCYEDECYVETDKIISRHEIGNYLFTINDSHNQLNGTDVYQYKDNKLIVDTGNNYQIYILYEEEE